MRFLYTLFFVFLIGIIGSSWFKMVVGADPKEEAYAFAKAVESGNLAKSVKHFGSNVCRCPHKGGWGAYLIYASGEEPNLAFMVGHPFSVGTATVTHLKNNVAAAIPWQKPEDTQVDLPLTFKANTYQPLFLPLAMAYGQKMTESELAEFLKDPDNGAWKGLTLRLRPSLKPGLTDPPKEPLPKSVDEQFKPTPSSTLATPSSNDNEAEDEARSEEAIKDALGAQATAYLHAKDPAPVVTAAGAVVPADKIKPQLPRLQSAVLRLHVVRRGAVNEWTIYHFGLIDPVLEYADGHRVALEHYLRPSTKEAENAARQLKQRLEQSSKSEAK